MHLMNGGNNVSLFFDYEKKGNALCVRLKGELDHHTSDDLRERLTMLIETEDIHHLILNLGQLDFMDSSGLGVILGRYNQIKSRNGEMFICSVSTTVGKMFEMSGMYKIIKSVPSEEEALLGLGVA